uniref:H15 domain-containing protein n=1 Tax=Strigops habroptila TaxID=2489341 RepID=A0A672U085_STRHB
RCVEVGSIASAGEGRGDEDGEVDSVASGSGLYKGPPSGARGRPSLSDLILRAVCLSPARKGTSLAVIKKTLVADGYDVRRNSGRLKAALNSLVNKGLLERVTGSGVAGSFRIGGVGNEQVERKARRGRAAGGARRGGGGRAAPGGGCCPASLKELHRGTSGAALKGAPREGWAAPGVAAAPYR